MAAAVWTRPAPPWGFSGAIRKSKPAFGSRPGHLPNPAAGPARSRRGGAAPGGRLLYITCTTEPAENEELIESFLAAHQEFHLATDPHLLPAAARLLVQPPGYFRTSPAEHDLDGFSPRSWRRKGRVSGYIRNINYSLLGLKRQ